MRLDLDKLEQIVEPLLTVHGLELVALDWLQGPGHGILRVYIDRPGGDPRTQDPAVSVTLDEVTLVTRDVSTALDALDFIEGAYTLEIGSPGPERPVQKRADFDRFAGLSARVDARGVAREKLTFRGVLKGTTEAPEGQWTLRMLVDGKTLEVPGGKIVRARLHEIASPKIRAEEKPVGASRRQERLQAREKARQINAAKSLAAQTPASRAATTVTDEDTKAREGQHRTANGSRTDTR